MVIIGRPHRSTGPGSESPDVSIKDDYVSHGHIRIYYRYDEHCFMVEERNSGSTNGTFIGREQNDNFVIQDRLEKGRPHSLADGDLIALARVGQDYRVVFRFRQSEGTLTGTAGPEKHSGSGLVVDTAARRVWVNGKEVPLRKKEFDLLAFLYENRGKACSRQEIAEKVWAEERGIISEEAIDADIHRIREMIEKDSAKPQYIKTLRRYGYRMDK